MTAMPGSGSISNRSNIQSVQAGIFDNVVSILNELLGGGAQAANVSLASNTFTPGNGAYCFEIETNAGGGTDTLNTITTTNIRDGQVILIRSHNNAHVITVTNAAGGTGQILTADGNNIIMSNTKLFIALKYNLATTSFEEVFRSIPIASGGGSSTPDYFSYTYFGGL